jgi:aerobic carbon-monoxide dehydrogenase medium subunit
MYDFAYHRPATVEEAAKLLAGKPDAKPMSGGMSLLPSMKLRLSHWSDIVDLAAIPNLTGVREENGHIIIGARTRHYDVATSPLLHQKLPALAELAEGIGDPLVRNRGTIGGSIANADPAADYPSSVLGLGATIITNKREIAGDTFFTGLFETALQHDEIITALRYPIALRAAYMKYRQPASRYAIVGAFVAQTQQGVRVAITGAASHVFRMADYEAALTKTFSASALDGIAPLLPALNSDLHASADYRAHVITEMVRRAVDAAFARKSI